MHLVVFLFATLLLHSQRQQQQQPDYRSSSNKNVTSLHVALRGHPSSSWKSTTSDDDDDDPDDSIARRHLAVHFFRIAKHSLASSHSPLEASSSPQSHANTA